MSVSVTFFSLISQLLSQANEGLHEALDAASDSDAASDPVSGGSLMFVAPKIEIQLKCVVIDNNGVLEVVPSNGALSNQYGADGDSIVSLEFKLKP